MLNNNKIAYLVNIFPVISETFIVNQVIAAIDAGYSVNIFARKLLSLKESSQEDLLSRYKLMSKCIKMHNYSTKKIDNLKTVLKILMQYKYSALLHSYRSLRSSNFGFNGFGLYNFISTAMFLSDNSHIHHAQFGPNGKLLVQAKYLNLIKGKIITTFHGYDASSNFMPFEELKIYYSNLFNVGDFFTVNTPYLAEQLAALGCPKDKLYIIPMGIDTLYFKPKQKNITNNSSINLLSVGRLVKFKSFDLGIRAMSILISEGYHVQYTIIGDGDQKEYLRGLAANLGISKHVKFTGALNQEMVRNYMQESDIFLMTSTHDENMRRETQGVVTAEAQACGLPVCAFRSGGIPYTLKDGETGFLSEEKNIKEFTKNIKILINNDELRYKMSLAARDFIKQNYSVNVSAKKLITIYNSL